MLVCIYEQNGVKRGKDGAERVAQGTGEHITQAAQEGEGERLAGKQAEQPVKRLGNAMPETAQDESRHGEEDAQHTGLLFTDLAERHGNMHAHAAEDGEDECAKQAVRIVLRHERVNLIGQFGQRILHEKRAQGSTEKISPEHDDELRGEISLATLPVIQELADAPSEQAHGQRDYRAQAEAEQQATHIGVLTAELRGGSEADHKPGVDTGNENLRRHMVLLSWSGRVYLPLVVVLLELRLPEHNFSGAERFRDIDDSLIPAAAKDEGSVLLRLDKLAVDKHVDVLHDGQILHVLPEISCVQPDALLWQKGLEGGSEECDLVQVLRFQRFTAQYGQTRDEVS